MTTTATTRRSASQTRNDVLAELKADHKRVKKAYSDFQKLDAAKDPQACEAIVRKVLDELTVHAALEEELLYPAASAAMKDDSLIEEAKVEHESVHTLIDQLRGMEPQDKQYAARFTVLCEYVLHHVKEEEGEMFPKLERERVDWDALGSDMQERRQELMQAQDREDADGTRAMSSQDEDAGFAPGSRKPGSGSTRRPSTAGRAGPGHS